MVEIISHRGGAFIWPENSLTAFRESAGLGVEMVECDVHLSADGVPMVHHDAVLERTSEGSGPLSALPAEALAALRLRGARGDRIPTLAAVAALVAPTRLRLQVEVKSPPGAEPPPELLPRTLAVLDEAGLRARSGIIAFHAPTAAAAQAAGGLDHVAWLFDGTMLRALGAEGVVGVARAHGLRMVETNMASLDAALLGALRGAGLRVAAWGANHAPEIGRALALGLDAMATDDPVLALRLRG